MFLSLLFLAVVCESNNDESLLEIEAPLMQVETWEINVLKALDVQPPRENGWIGLNVTLLESLPPSPNSCDYLFVSPKIQQQQSVTIQGNASTSLEIYGTSGIELILSVFLTSCKPIPGRRWIIAWNWILVNAIYHRQSSTYFYTNVSNTNLFSSFSCTPLNADFRSCPAWIDSSEEQSAVQYLFNKIKAPSDSKFWMGCKGDSTGIFKWGCQREKSVLNTELFAQNEALDEAGCVIIRNDGFLYTVSCVEEPLPGLCRSWVTGEFRYAGVFNVTLLTPGTQNSKFPTFFVPPTNRSIVQNVSSNNDTNTSLLVFPENLIPWKPYVTIISSIVMFESIYVRILNPYVSPECSDGLISTLNASLSQIPMKLAIRNSPDYYQTIEGNDTSEIWVRHQMMPIIFPSLRLNFCPSNRTRSVFLYWVLMFENTEFHETSAMYFWEGDVMSSPVPLVSRLEPMLDPCDRVRNYYRQFGAVIFSEEENNLVATIRSRYGPKDTEFYLCALGDGSGIWRWGCFPYEGLQFNYTNWAPGEPSNQRGCVVYQKSTRWWFTKSCDLDIYPLCRYGSRDGIENSNKTGPIYGYINITFAQPQNSSEGEPSELSIFPTLINPANNQPFDITIVINPTTCRWQQTIPPNAIDTILFTPIDRKNGFSFFRTKWLQNATLFSQKNTLSIHIPPLAKEYDHSQKVILTLRNLHIFIEPTCRLDAETTFNITALGSLVSNTNNAAPEISHGVATATNIATIGTAGVAAFSPSAVTAANSLGVPIMFGDNGCSGDTLKSLSKEGSFLISPLNKVFGKQSMSDSIAPVVYNVVLSVCILIFHKFIAVLVTRLSPNASTAKTMFPDITLMVVSLLVQGTSYSMMKLWAQDTEVSLGLVVATGLLLPFSIMGYCIFYIRTGLRSRYVLYNPEVVGSTFFKRVVLPQGYWSVDDELWTHGSLLQQYNNKYVHLILVAQSFCVGIVSGMIFLDCQVLMGVLVGFMGISFLYYTYQKPMRQPMSTYVRASSHLVNGGIMIVSVFYPEASFVELLVLVQFVLCTSDVCLAVYATVWEIYFAETAKAEHIDQLRTAEDEMIEKSLTDGMELSPSSFKRQNVHNQEEIFPPSPLSNLHPNNDNNNSVGSHLQRTTFKPPSRPNLEMNKHNFSVSGVVSAVSAVAVANLMRMSDKSPTNREFTKKFEL
eukprot:PhF_6_TR41295/c0_g1_i1/m.62504